MIVGGNTVITMLAMFGPQRLLNVTDSAVFVLDEKNHVFILGNSIQINLDFVVCLLAVGLFLDLFNRIHVFRRRFSCYLLIDNNFLVD